MTDDPFHITVFEHDWLRIDKPNYLNRTLPVSCYEALCNFYGENGVIYFNLIHNGVKFKEYVGVLQIGKFTIEILPKADKSIKLGEEARWQKVLISMLLKSGNSPVSAPTYSDLQLKKNNILELYVNLFLDKVQQLINEGLLKKYKLTEGNLYVLKGRLLFSRQLQNNLIHAERFFTSYTTYNHNNVYNQIICQTLKLIPEISSTINSSKARQLLLSFPELDNLKVTDTLFDKLVIDRKTERYRPVLMIAKLLLLNYYPGLSTGRNHILALMFDMNKLWEKYVLKSLKEASVSHDDMEISGQEIEEFWDGRTIRPDIIIRTGAKTFIIDTKWKLLKDSDPSIEDVRQMYAYNHHFNSGCSVLLYPDAYRRRGKYSKYALPNLHTPDCAEHGCGVVFANILNSENQIELDFGNIILNQILEVNSEEESCNLSYNQKAL